MHLKRLEAFGFKSFADKVSFDFERGMTVFVGPNGCGKSNVVDSIKWVLGDQSAKSLRGSEMMDVIFNGSALRKPLNFAEVTLTFENSSGVLRVQAPEVSITRRLYRSGESEYLINKAVCRLMDIRQLFWDTGAGTSSYSIIEQGRIGVLLEANPKERRGIIEEAAGIHQYKERKKNALRRLERVEQNLLRITDILNELERNLRSVTRQAAKARRAKEISDRLRQIKIEILLFETYAGRSSLQEIEAALGAAQDQVTELSSELGKAQQTTVSEEERLQSLDLEHAQTQAELSELRTRQAALEESIRAERRSLEEMATESERARTNARDAGERAAAVSGEREKTELDLLTARQTLANRSASVKTITEVLTDSQNSYQDTAQNLERARREAVDALGRRTQRHQALTQAEADLSGIDYRIRSSRAEISKAEDQLKFAQAEGKEVRNRMDQIRRRRESLETERAGIRNLQIRTEDEIDRVSARAQELRNEIEKCRSRRAVLEDLHESGEGLSPGVRAVITDLRNDGSDRGEVLGLVADCLGVEPRLERAVEAALGSYIEGLVVESAATADQLLARLREDGLGRATFLSLDRLQNSVGPYYPHSPPPGLAAHELNAPGCLGRAADLVICDQDIKLVAEALLGDVLVYENEQAAQNAFSSRPFGARWRRVSLEGAYLEPNGALSGGSYRVDRLGLIGRKNEIARLDRIEDEQRLKTGALEDRISFLEKRAQRLAHDDERLTHDLAALADTGTELKGILSAIEREESRSHEERRVAADEIQELSAERETHAQRIAQLRTDLEALKSNERVLGEQTEQLARRLADQEGTVARHRNALEEMKRDVSTLTVQVEALARQEHSLSEQFSHWRDETHRESSRADALDDRRKSNQAALADKEQDRSAWATQIEELDKVVTTLAEGKDNARLNLENSRGHERALSQQLDHAREQASEIDHRRLELRLGLKGKLEQVRNEFQMDAEEELTNRGTPPEINEEMRAEVEDLEDKLNKLGPVNMYALEEQKQVEERLSWNKNQADDLQSARSQVKDVINRINRKSRKQFEETFEAVRQNFNDIFRKLFGGGKAELVLEEGEDILEAGIEIRARPPGKEPRSIMQLSGGEKAMTTIALMMAVFRSRPAPFCILDEVDAPLDEANVDRFNLILQEFMDRSQFVVITHNKRTMQYASILYGITMPEPGVSKRIAVKYEQIEEHLPMDEINKQALATREKAKAEAGHAGANQVEEAMLQAETAESVGGGDD